MACSGRTRTGPYLRLHPSRRAPKPVSLLPASSLPLRCVSFRLHPTFLNLRYNTKSFLNRASPDEGPQFPGVYYCVDPNLNLLHPFSSDVVAFRIYSLFGPHVLGLCPLRCLVAVIIPTSFGNMAGHKATNEPTLGDKRRRNSPIRPHPTHNLLLCCGRS